jgi:hypothetical protein
MARWLDAGAVLVRDHDDDEIIPIISGRLPCQEAPDFLPLPTHTMGGKTIGDELGECSTGQPGT